MLPSVPAAPSTDFTALPMLTWLSAAQHDRLRAVSWTRNLPSGRVVQQQGDPVTYLLALEAGVVKASRHTAGGREVALAVERAPAAFDKHVPRRTIDSPAWRTHLRRRRQRLQSRNLKGPSSAQRHYPGYWKVRR
jgi:CRP-like cAMP-binding protein